MASELLETVKWEPLELDGKKRQQTRAVVDVAVNRELDAGLPDVYDRRTYAEKCSRRSSTFVADSGDWPSFGNSSGSRAEMGTSSWGPFR